MIEPKSTRLEKIDRDIERAEKDDPSIVNDMRLLNLRVKRYFVECEDDDEGRSVS